LKFNSRRTQASLLALKPGQKPQPNADHTAYFSYYGLDLEKRYPGVSHHLGYFEAVGFKLATHYYAHPQAVGTCFVLHGYYDHVGLYDHLIDYCLSQNYSVFAYDLPGHGLSTGERVSINSFAEYAQVLDQAVKQFAEQLPRPHIAIAQSTGAAILMDYLLAQCGGSTQAPFEHQILFAPLLRPGRWWWGKLVYHAMSRFAESVSRRYGSNSDDPSFLHFVRHRDPLQSRRLSVGWVGAMDAWIKRFPSLPVSELAPVIIQGDKDKTVDWQWNLPEIVMKFPRARVEIIRGGHHHLVNASKKRRAKIFAAMGLPGAKS
jgi:lysophospholipase